jgi:hypothetical protein
MEEYVELFVYQGANFYSTIHLSDATTNAFMNIATTDFRGRIKKSASSANLKGNLVFTKTDMANGIVEISMSAANTALMDQGRYVYSVKMTTANGDVLPVIGGSLFVLPDV